MLKSAGTVKKLKSWNVGMRRVNRIVQQETQAGNTAFATGIYSDDVDILVHKGNQLVRVYEVTNYAMDGYIQMHRGVRYRNNLLRRDVEKVFVCSSDKNLAPLGGRRFFTQHGIKVVVKGYQD